MQSEEGAERALPGRGQAWCGSEGGIWRHSLNVRTCLSDCHSCFIFKLTTNLLRRTDRNTDRRSGICPSTNGFSSSFDKSTAFYANRHDANLKWGLALQRQPLAYFHTQILIETDLYQFTIYPRFRILIIALLSSRESLFPISASM